MKIRNNQKPLFKKSFFIGILLLIGLGGLAGCVSGTATIPKGWSGGVVADNNLYIGSMAGKLVALELPGGNRSWVAPLETIKQPSGGFGCAPAPTSVAIYGSPAVSGNLTYIGGYNGNFYAFAPGRTEPRWIYPRQGTIGAPIIGGPAVAGDKVYFGAANGKVYALNATDGFKEWEFTNGDKIWSSPAVAEGTLFIGSFDKKLYALDARNGSKKWEYTSQGAIVATPVIDKGTVYFGSFDRFLYALNASDGSLKWKFEAGGWFWAKPVIYNNVIYAPNLDGKVYALDMQNGNKLSEFDLGVQSHISSSPVMVDNQVIAATEAGVIWALDTETLQKKLLASLGEKVYASLASRLGTVYVHTAKDTLYAVDARSGATTKFNISQ